MPKAQTKPGLSPRELDALRRQYLAEQKQAESASRWELANDIASGINDIVGRGVIAPIAGGLGDVNQALWDAGAWVNNKIKDVEYATGMVKPDLSSLVTGQRKGYIPYSQGNAYLGSEDIANRMERAGLVSPKRRPKAELAASLISPSAAAKTAINAPKTAMNMLRMADNLEAPSRGVRTADGMYIPRGQMGAIDLGVAEVPQADYRISHRPMTVDSGSSTLDDLTKSFGNDIYTDRALQIFGSGDKREADVLKQLRMLRGNPNKEVTIYRGVPGNAEKINYGDWVTLSKDAAQDYAKAFPDGKVISQKVPASHVTAWADSLLEQGYYPPKQN